MTTQFVVLVLLVGAGGAGGCAEVAHRQTAVVTGFGVEGFGIGAGSYSRGNHRGNDKNQVRLTERRHSQGQEEVCCEVVTQLPWESGFTRQIHIVEIMAPLWVP